MAIIQRGILGGFSNKIGNVVGTSWKGIAVMKSLPLSVANPRTALQVAQRNKFTYLSKLGSQLLASHIKPLWDRFAQRESGYNAFIRTNLPYVVGDTLFNAQDFKLSIGKLTSATITSAAFSEISKNLTLQWDQNSGQGLALADDQVYIVVAYGDGNQETLWVKGPTGLTRQNASAVIPVQDWQLGQNIQVYLSFRRADGSMVSTSETAQAV